MESFSVFISSVNGNVRPKCCTGWLFRATKEHVKQHKFCKTIFFKDERSYSILIPEYVFQVYEIQIIDYILIGFLTFNPR